ncbi:tetratricopeptide repeat domain protein [Lunatimonas lonarensis]|uniref:Tetratricopeptide repeat domain protein n=1 Tax=Lunatimonas lonarensis TaxID=1232681 RepID=R7ZPE9_9BACT|nr:tetratricopeptide repeat domain protein [Lunatimonas lonarensis]EON75962.1 tetratricopeptide repeat domain protein [Lunatimonas lonarensis]
MPIAPQILLFILLLIPASWKKIGERNRALKEATAAYVGTDFEESVRRHLVLINDFQLGEPEVKFNLGLSYQNNGQEEDALKTYSELSLSRNKTIASFSANQAGVLEGRESNYKEALTYFKTALLKNPENEAARYNYELLSRWLAENEEEEKQQQDQEDQEKLEPSNYAKRMKAQADSFVDQFRFGEALQTMKKALEIDETVRYYEGFINNLNDINEIDGN